MINNLICIQFVTGIVRLSQCHVWVPSTHVSSGHPKYTASIMIPKGDTKTINGFRIAFNSAIKLLLSKLAGKTTSKTALMLPLQDGDTDGKGTAYHGNYLVNTSNDHAPQIVDLNSQPILDHGEVYSGCYARVTLSIFIFVTDGKIGVACRLDKIKKVLDGERLDDCGTEVTDLSSTGGNKAGNRLL